MADLDAMLKAVESGGTYRESKDQEDARQLLEMLEQLGELRPGQEATLEQLRQNAPANQQEIGATDATYRGALQGASFQQADEIYGLFGGDKGAARLKNLEAEVAHPSEYRTGKTAGALGSGAAMAALTGPFAAGKTLLGTMGRSGALGALEGALWGAGGGNDAQEKLSEGIKYGLFGAGAGVAAPALVQGGAAALRAGDDLLRGAAGFGNKKRANRAVMDMLRKAGMSVDDVADDVARAAAQGQPEYRLMDATGVAGTRKASGISRAGGDGAEEIAQYLRSRQLGQGERVAQFTDDAFDLGGDTAEDIVKVLKKGRGDAADVAYAAARGNAAPVDVRGAVATIDARIGGMRGSNITGDSIDAKLSRFRNRLVADPAPNGEISRELSDFDRVLGVKQDVQDAAEAAKRAGRNNEARELKKLVRELDSALEGASDMYRAANDQFAKSSRVIDAVDQGAKMTMPQRRSANTIRQFLDMTPDQQAAARAGYGDKMLAGIESNKAPTSNKARAFQSPKVRAETEAIAADPTLFRNRMDRETAMWETQNRALGGSMTADNLQDVADAGVLADAARAGRDVATGNVGNAVVNAGRGAARLASGQNEATRNLIAKMLMSDNPAADLAQAVSQARNSERVKRIFEGLLRAGGRDKGVPALGLQ